MLTKGWTGHASTVDGGYLRQREQNGGSGRRVGRGELSVSFYTYTCLEPFIMETDCLHSVKNNN